MVVDEQERLTGKVVDFGIAAVLNLDNAVGQKLTRTGELFASPVYMSPEQCMGCKCDQRSDIYSLGCVMYEALTGCPPPLPVLRLPKLPKNT